MIKFLLTFGAGIYAGIYISQNYEVPRVDDPPSLIQKLNQKIRDMAEEHRKNYPGKAITVHTHEVDEELRKNKAESKLSETNNN